MHLKINIKDDAKGTAERAGCVCGCDYFVWWIENQRRYSSETLWQYYDKARHHRAVCRDCNRDVIRRNHEHKE